MKRKLFKSLFAVAAIAAVGLGSYKAYGSYVTANLAGEKTLLVENVEALAKRTEVKLTVISDSSCKSGGVASSSCSSSTSSSLGAGVNVSIVGSGGGVNVNVESGTACSVTCDSGFYACCSSSCNCKPLYSYKWVDL